MFLTRQIKQELTASSEAAACCKSWELKALLVRHGYFTIRNNVHVLSIVVDSSALARHLFNLLRAAGVALLEVIRQQGKRLQKNQFLVQISGCEQVDALLIYLDFKEAGKELSLPRLFSSAPGRQCCGRAFLRGAFLAGGSISVSRRSDYHLEINCGSPEDAQAYQRTLASFNLVPFLRRRNGSTFLYFKNAETIADYLRIIGAGSALLHLESMRVVKSMRNQVNRLVNCDTANLEKVVVSAQQQLRLIDQVERCIGLNKIPPSLREAALIRRCYPEASLKELGELLDRPISKSGMNHRFRHMERLVNEKGETKKRRFCTGQTGKG